MNTFSDLDLVAPLQRALAAEGYTCPTPVQARAIPPLLQGRDLLGCAQTGTGKTAAFALPTLQHLSGRPRTPPAKGARALVLTPTRELAIQVEESFRAYGRYLGLRTTVIFGGVGQAPQVQAMARGVDVLVATPGRLLDLMNQGHIRLDEVEIFVLDEADRMLDMGFIHDVRRVIEKLPRKRQSLFFSATMPPPIVELAGRILTDPARVDVSPGEPTVDRIDQSVVFTEKTEKPTRLRDMLLAPEIERAIVFTRTKHGANRVVKQLAPSVVAEAIHGNKSQTARQRALENFKTGHTRVLVATDLAARGIDVDGITHVFNYDLPNEPESYVHRIGRTARAGASGRAISFCDHEERPYLAAIERLIARRIPVLSGAALRPDAARALPPVQIIPDLGPPPRSQRGGPRSGAPRPAAPRPQSPPRDGRPEPGTVVWHGGAARPAAPRVAAAPATQPPPRVQRTPEATPASGSGVHVARNTPPVAADAGAVPAAGGSARRGRRRRRKPAGASPERRS